MPHPFERLPSPVQKYLFWALLFLTLAIFGSMALTGGPLNTAAAPSGIVSFELAGSTAKAAEILASWDAGAQMRAAFIQGLDFLLLLVYSTTVGIGCLWAGKTLAAAKWPLGRLGSGLAWGQWLAAIFDALENIALTILLFSPVVSPWPEIALVCASAKFALLFAGLVYAFYGLAVRAAVKVR